mmetsp:Transcript_33085/g.83998  ORF Transcript_33085/g.83998 Transcript_33085/m.83998 type:complete len:237 (+) Transcript_33085:236-946(+)
MSLMISSLISRSSLLIAGLAPPASSCSNSRRFSSGASGLVGLTRLFSATRCSGGSSRRGSFAMAAISCAVKWRLEPVWDPVLAPVAAASCSASSSAPLLEPGRAWELPCTPGASTCSSTACLSPLMAGGPGDACFCSRMLMGWLAARERCSSWMAWLRWYLTLFFRSRAAAACFFFSALVSMMNFSTVCCMSLRTPALASLCSSSSTMPCITRRCPSGSWGTLCSSSNSLGCATRQ